MRRWGTLLLALVLTSGCGGGGTTASPSTPAGTPAPTVSPSPSGPKLLGCPQGPEVPLTTHVVTAPGGQPFAVGVAGDGPVAVVVANTLVGHLCDWLPWVQDLTKRGYRAAIFDYSFIPTQVGIPAAVGKGSSDLVAVAGKLEELGAQKVVYAGGSLGGSVALNAATRDNADPAGVIVLSGGLPELEKEAASLKVPVVYAVAEDDYGAYNTAKALSKVTKDATLKVYPGAAHANEMFRVPSYAPKLQNALAAFLKDLG
ncbi:alpha/beta hydrolase [Nonomuraea sp. NPDC050556]|uniref:alpha/beta hydrolase n=1 Tax=Nonomuraea sp. NPDC050556 TaxID=3364369 RepID=UPI00379A870C